MALLRAEKFEDRAVLVGFDWRGLIRAHQFGIELLEEIAAVGDAGQVIGVGQAFEIALGLLLFVLTFIVLAIARLMLARLEIKAGK